MNYSDSNCDCLREDLTSDWLVFDSARFSWVCLRSSLSLSRSYSMRDISLSDLLFCWLKRSFWWRSDCVCDCRSDLVCCSACSVNWSFVYTSFNWVIWATFILNRFTTFGEGSSFWGGNCLNGFSCFEAGLGDRERREMLLLGDASVGFAYGTGGCILIYPILSTLGLLISGNFCSSSFGAPLIIASGSNPWW